MAWKADGGFEARSDLLKRRVHMGMVRRDAGGIEDVNACGAGYTH